MNMEGKKWWQSKTILMNAVVSLLGLVALVMPQAAGASSFLQAHAAEVSVVWGMLNVLLRLVTKDKIQLGD
jgi:hypothetical protein